MTRVLVVGVPRSGTSWVGRVLGSTGGATYLGEPDNHEHTPFGLRAKLGLPGYFYPRPEGGADEYERLWRAAFAMHDSSAAPGPVDRARRKASLQLLRFASEADLLDAFREPSRGRLTLRAAAALAVPERPSQLSESLVVKSVHAQLALEWIVSRFAVQVLIVLRHPLNVLSSWSALGWLDHTRNDMLDELDPRVQNELAALFGVQRPEAAASPLTRAAWLFGALSAWQLAAVARNPTWRIVSHERLCEHPSKRLSELAAQLGLRWTDENERQLADMNGPGEGYDTRRVASELPDIWRSRLTDEQVREVSGVLEPFPVESWTGAV